MNIGFAGFGSMGKVHAYSALSCRYYFETPEETPFLYGVCASSHETARTYAEKFGIAKAYSSFEEMIRDDAIDIVDICTPNIYHLDMITAALEAGKDIYCEKPLCASFKDAKTAADAAAESSSVCGVVFNTRFLLPVMRAKELISAGRIGRILSYDFSFLHSSALDTNKTGWKQDRRYGGGVLYDLGSHAVDLAEHLCGRIESVSGKSQIAFETRRSFDGEDGWRTNADEAFYLRGAGRDGAVGTIRVGKIFHGTNDDFRFEIYGTKGSLSFNLMDPNFLKFYDAEADPLTRGVTAIECVGRYPAPATGFPGIKAPVGWLRGHIGSMHNFLSCAASRRVPSPSFEDGARNLAVLDAAYRSDAESGREIKVGES